jgi:hypothetical protein
MTRPRWIRRTAGGLLPIVLVTGCAGGWTRLDEESLAAPEPARSYRVATRDGRTLTFIDLHLEGDFLVGTRRETVEERVGEGDAARTSVTNRYEEVRLPWSEVKTVEAERERRSASSYLLAAGALGVGVAAFLLLSGNGETDPDGGGGGKGF